MTTRAELERAVIETARALIPAMEFGAHIGIDDACTAIIKAVAALDAHEAGQATAGVSEGVAWNTIAVGDQVRGKTGFYPVTGVLALAGNAALPLAGNGVLSLTGGKVRLTIDIRGTLKTIVRPTETEPTATIKRGPDGAAVQVFVDVFSSKEG